MKRFVFLFFLLTGSLVGWSQIQLDSTVLDTQTLVSGLDIPWEITYGNDDHLWVTERYGRVSRIDPETKTTQILLDLSAQVWQDGEAGLLGLALHPDFPTDNRVYGVYTYAEGADRWERLVSWQFDGTSLVQENTLFDGIPANRTHNGSRLLFLPDHTLLMTTGDAQDLSSPQNLSALTGKTLRFTPEGGVPADNPIPGSPVWSWGHRNAQGLTLGPGNRIFSSEHGPSTDDEVNLLEKGRNYGWPNVPGLCDLPSESAFCADSNVAEPLLHWTPTIAVSDLVYYDHPAIPEFRGSLLMTTLKARKVVRLRLGPDQESVVDERNFFIDDFNRLRDIAVAPDGRIFLATSGTEWGNTNPFTHRIIEVRNPAFSSVPEPPGAENALHIFPNPAREGFQWRVNQTLLGGEWRLLDALGREISTGSVRQLTNTWSRETQPAGLYFLEVTQGAAQVRQRVVLR